MPVLHFLPWCRLDREYLVDRVALSPLDTTDLSSFDMSLREDLAEELSRVVDVTGKPVSRVTILRLTDRDSLAEFSAPADWTEAIESLDLACFCALARRDFLGWMDRGRLGAADAVKNGRKIEELASLPVGISVPSWQDTYCNAGCFEPIPLPFGDKRANVMFIGTGRRDRYLRETFALRALKFTASLHVNSLIRPGILLSIDERLLQAVLSHRLRCQSAKSRKPWEDWYDGIENFNQSNSDNPAVRWQTEWVLMCSAFRRVLLEDKYRAKQVAHAFGARFLPIDPFLSKIGSCESDLENWLYDFHSPRHDFGHGRQAGSKFKPDRPGGWQPIGGLLIAAILFPLLVRSLLSREGVYSLTDSDRCQFAGAVELTRRFPADRFAPAEEVREFWMELVNGEWAKLLASKSITPAAKVAP